MIFDRKISDKGIQQLRSLLEDVLTDALGRQERELAQGQAEQTARLDEMMERNQKTVRSLSDTVEDFLDTMQEEHDVQEQAQQAQRAAAERERQLLKLLELYREQMELFEQWTAGQNHADSETAAEAWRQQYAMLNGKIKAEGRLCAIEDIGMAGEQVDYRFHEVLQAVEPETQEQEGTVAKVCSRGMLYQGNVVRKARVVAYRKA